MARFLCCTRQSNDGSGAPVWINIELVSAIEVDKFGLGSKISFAGQDTPHFYAQEQPQESFERTATGALRRGSGEVLLIWGQLKLSPISACRESGKDGCGRSDPAGDAFGLEQQLGLAAERG
jgi:hypothetical protein